MLSTLETRLDNVVYRLNLARSRRQARQLVSHGHILVNEKRVNTPSYNVKLNDIIMVSAKSANLALIKKNLEDSKDSTLPEWLDRKATTGKIVALPKRENLDVDINERLIVEYYSR